MARGEFVHNAIWSDPPFPSLSLEGQHLYLWSFTNPRCNMAGLYRLDISVMTEAKIPRRKVEAIVDELAHHRMLFFVDDVLWCRERVRFIHSRNQNIAKAIASDVRFIRPDHPLRVAFLAEYGTDPWLAAPLLSLNAQTGDTYVDLSPKALASQNQKRSPNVPSRFHEPTDAVHSSSSEEQEGFEEWLEHHARTTSLTPPRSGTKARAEIVAGYAARRAEGYTLDELKLATSGAFGDPHRQEHGYFTCESVLRPTKVHDLIEKGRKKPHLASVPQQNVSPLGVGRCSGCSATGKLFQGRCPTCQEAWERRVLGEDGAA